MGLSSLCKGLGPLGTSVLESKMAAASSTELTEELFPKSILTGTGFKALGLKGLTGNAIKAGRVAERAV